MEPGLHIYLFRLRVGWKQVSPDPPHPPYEDISILITLLRVLYETDFPQY